MLQVSDIALTRADVPLFDGMTFTVHPGQKVGVVGANGIGKSTLFALILHRLMPERGDVEYPRPWRVCHMAQEMQPSARHAIDFVIDGCEDLRCTEQALTNPELSDEQLAELHARLDDLGAYQAKSRAGQILTGLGFGAGDFAKPHKSFSGGWRIRLNLAKALMTPADLLLLDEPTNHLDLEATLWLENWLKRWPGTLLAIAHDREFLDNTTDHILHIADRQATLYRGGYSSFERQRAETLTRQRVQYARQQKQIAHMEDFVRRFRAKASKAKQAQSRLKALERMDRMLPVHLSSPYSFPITAPRRMSHPLVSLRDVSLGYDGVRVLDDIGQTILPGARIGIIGANGAGKSTFLKCLVRELQPQSGELMFGEHSSTGYFAQHQLELLDATASALATVADHKPIWREQQSRDFLGTWGFDAGMIERPISSLSGGEKARLVLACIALHEPALLVLDEPTNHLDIEMRESLARALQDYTGALVIVAHDRSLLTSVVDEFWLADNGCIRVFQGDLAAYTERTAMPAAPINERARRSSRTDQRRASAEKRAALQPLRNELSELERSMDAITAELRGVEGELADPEVYRSAQPDAVDALLRNAAKLRSRLEETEERWLARSNELETLADQPR